MHGGEADLWPCSQVSVSAGGMRDRLRAKVRGVREGLRGSSRLPDCCVASGTVIAASTAPVVVAVM